MVANQVIAFKKQSETQLEQIRRLEDREKLLMSQLQILEKDMAAKTVSSDLHRRKVSELNQKQTELIEKLATMQGKFNEAERTLKEKIQIIADDANTQRRMEERMDALKRKVDAQSKSSNVTDSYLQQENDDLKLLVKCSSCTNNFKSHVLLKCMHTFCKGCLDDLVNSRQRKCPKCGIPFGHADIKPFYL
ncbi:hypothetical protein BC830DRAFT_1064285 [Chytriomyces sp. MP71]|nr:hypothetical protein BC830DRAFT_1064285 [Chytriomyces sp. MP71]